MLNATASRVEQNTPAAINRGIQREIDRRLEYYAAHPREIQGRLAELHREWDIERALEANAAVAALAGVGLAAFVDRRFMLLPAAVAGFLLQHALQGWCPPVPVMRRLGIRTAAEICEERCGLRRLHDDYMAGPQATASTPSTTGQAQEIHEGVEA